VYIVWTVASIFAFNTLLAWLSSQICFIRSAHKIDRWVLI
jgi:hypothetical protein